ncbi:MAG: hypothetical protein LLG04_11630 [Parachlamydia sp.]|nr:hypothetical protein [Parachlamydia sp.]
MEIGPRITFTQELARIYKQLKKSDKLLASQKVTLFINEKGNLAIFENKKDAKLQHFKKLDRKELYKQIKLEASKGTIDHKIARTAVKALLLLPLKNPFEIKTILSDFPHITSAISPTKSQEIESMLPHIQELKRSEEGGNGVIFFDCKQSESSSGVQSFVIKFVSEARTILCADRFLQAMGFRTPKSCYVHGTSPLKAKLIAATLDNLKFIHPDNHTQVKKQTSEMRCVLIMSILKEAISLRRLPGNTLLKLLNQDNVLLQLGRMIFIDHFMNNTDRLNINTCNLGNMLIDDDAGHLYLIDHEMRLTGSEIETVKNNLKLLLTGKLTNEIIVNLEGALKFDRKNFGAVALLEELKQKMKKGLELGIQKAAVDLCRLFESPTAFNHIFQPHLEESEKIDSKTFLDLVKFVSKLLK